MKGAGATGCLGGCALLAGLPLLVVALVAGLLVALATGLASLTPFGGAPSQPFGPAYYATVGAPSTLHDLGFGPSDAARIDRALAAVRRESPLVGRGALILRLAQRFGVDPLLLVGLWHAESQLCLDGLNTPRNRNWNCGNLIWPAAAPYAGRYGCEAGETSLNHRWTRCATPEGGIGVWFEYLVREPAYDDVRPDFFGMMRRYNPCSDPGNAANGFPCGDQYGRNILATIERAAGPPVAYQAPPAGGGGFLPDALPLVATWGGRPAPVTQEYGPSEWSRGAGRPLYDFGREYGLDGASHTGLDLGLAVGTPLFTPVAGEVLVAGGSGVYCEDQVGCGPYVGELRIRLANGDLLLLGHLRSIVVRPGQRLRAGERVGSSGTANGPHLHLEYRQVDRALPGGYRIIDPRTKLR